MSKIKVSCSPLTNTIYAGKVRQNKTMPPTWINKDDVTDDVIASVFEWLKHNCEDGETNYFEVKYPNTEGRILFELKDDGNLILN